MLARPEIILFDVYGTLFDVERHDWAEPDVVETMRAKQLQYTWLLTVMDRYVDFRDVTRRAIAYAADVHGVDGLDLTAALEAQAHVPPFPEVADALERLGHGARLGVLSNGDPESLSELLHVSGLGEHFDWIISVDEVRAYKPAPVVYAHGLTRTGADAASVLFVSSNAWDVAGAALAGLRVAWINRRGNPREQIDGEPETVVRSVTELADAVLASRRLVGSARPSAAPDA